MKFFTSCMTVAFEKNADGSTKRMFVQLSEVHGFAVVDFAQRKEVQRVMLPEIPEAQVCKLLGTTKATVQAVRDRTHWKSQEIRPRDPVLLGLCSQLELDDAVLRAKIDQGPAAQPASPPGTGPQPDVDLQPLYEDEFGA